MFQYINLHQSCVLFDHLTCSRTSDKHQCYKNNQSSGECCTAELTYQPKENKSVPKFNQPKENKSVLKIKFKKRQQK